LVLPFRRAQLDAVFLDAGNTLITFDHALVCGMLAEEGVDATPAELGRAEAAARPAVSRFLADGISSEVRDTFTFYVTRMLARLGHDGPDAAALAQRLVVRLRREVPTQRLWSQILPGVPEALRALRADGLRLVVVSNSDGTVEEGLTAMGLRALVDGVVDSAVVGVEKPDPGIFRHALELSGAQPGRVLHVGDLHAVDVLGARAAGLHAVLLDPHGDWDDVDCARTADLPSLVEALLGDAGGRP
jgi:putative hydrolase of the HAD superfamily